MVKDGRIWEPELTSALTGITRSCVIELATELGAGDTRGDAAWLR